MLDMPTAAVRAFHTQRSNAKRRGIPFLFTRNSLYGKRGYGKRGRIPHRDQRLAGHTRWLSRDREDGASVAPGACGAKPTRVGRARDAGMPCGCTMAMTIA